MEGNTEKITSNSEMEDMEHDLVEQEGEGAAKEYSHEMNEASVVLLFALYFHSLIASLDCFLGKDTRDHLASLNVLHSPDIIFLSEIKINDDMISQLTRFLGLPNKCFVPSIGQAGGIILLWKDGFKIEIVKQSSNMIHALVTNDPAKGQWFLSCVYGTPYKNDQLSQWNYIKDLSTSISIPWVLIGDLNIIMNPSERNSNTEITSQEVLDAIKESDLSDLGFIGNPFTWTSNSHGTGRNWKFFQHWLENDTCMNQILNAWKSNTTGSAAFFLSDKLSNTRHILSKWSKSMFGNIQARINSLQQDLTLLQTSDIQGSNTTKVMDLEKEIDTLNELQASSNRQKSRDHFCNDMDRNSKYFHIRANYRKTRNRIDSLQAQDGTWCQDRTSIENILVSHFKKISTTSSPPDCQNFLQHVPNCISEQDNADLVAVPSVQEIHEALSLMEP
ncbi:uncharacterized protein LOC113360043 [Papaver somniferum]|uniref:uncharacterized protein LOC113360043 n=1 Tax=Papaver somniferum TaxID=3469 RepID=UPI000E6F4F0F|nr:uncharacterized protein LOC113360043 [Papaver somniferum]